MRLNGDDEFPIAEEFHDLVGKTRESDLKRQEEKHLADRAERHRLFTLNNPGKITTNQAFLPEEGADEKLKSQIDDELAKQAAARKAATEKQDVQSTSDFPPPPTST